MVYRKLHQNVGTFNGLIEEEGKKYPGGSEEFAAKLSGRWRNGAPLVSFPTWESADAFSKELNALLTRSYKGEKLTEKEKARLSELRLQLTAYDYGEDTGRREVPVRIAHPAGESAERVAVRGEESFQHAGGAE